MSVASISFEAAPAPVELVADKPLKKHVCEVCQRAFSTAGHLLRHTRTHTGERNHPCPYPGCSTRCSRQDNLQQHYRMHISSSARRRSTRRSTRRSPTPTSPDSLVDEPPPLEDSQLHYLRRRQTVKKEPVDQPLHAPPPSAYPDYEYANAQPTPGVADCGDVIIMECEYDEADDPYGYTAERLLAGVVKAPPLLVDAYPKLPRVELRGRAKGKGSRASTSASPASSASVPVSPEQAPLPSPPPPPPPPVPRRRGRPRLCDRRPPPVPSIPAPTPPSALQPSPKPADAPPAPQPRSILPPLDTGFDFRGQLTAKVEADDEHLQRQLWSPRRPSASAHENATVSLPVNGTGIGTVSPQELSMSTTHSPPQHYPSVVQTPAYPSHKRPSSLHSARLSESSLAGALDEPEPARKRRRLAPPVFGSGTGEPPTAPPAYAAPPEQSHLPRQVEQRLSRSDAYAYTYEQDQRLGVVGPDRQYPASETPREEQLHYHAASSQSSPLLPGPRHPDHPQPQPETAIVYEPDTAHPSPSPVMQAQYADDEHGRGQPVYASFDEAGNVAYTYTYAYPYDYSPEGAGAGSPTAAYSYYASDAYAPAGESYAYPYSAPAAAVVAAPVYEQVSAAPYGWDAQTRVG